MLILLYKNVQSIVWLSIPHKLLSIFNLFYKYPGQMVPKLRKTLLRKKNHFNSKLLKIINK